MAGKTVANAVSAYGARVKPKLANIAIDGAPEDQLRGPLDTLFRELAEIGGLSAGSLLLARIPSAISSLSWIGRSVRLRYSESVR